MTDQESANWLKEQPKPEEIKQLADGSQYIPIGICENLLDELTNSNWSTSDFKFQIIKTGQVWFADASCVLHVLNRTIVGAVTYQISSRDDNMDYSATCLSYCIANACKRLGIRMGRGLNNRLAEGETSLPIIRNKEPFEPDEKSDQEWQAIKQWLESCVSKEEAQEYINTTSYNMTIEAKQIINSKPSKNEKK